MTILETLPGTQPLWHTAVPEDSAYTETSDFGYTHDLGLSHRRGRLLIIAAAPVETFNIDDNLVRPAVGASNQVTSFATSSVREGLRQVYRDYFRKLAITLRSPYGLPNIQVFVESPADERSNLSASELADLLVEAVLGDTSNPLDTTKQLCDLLSLRDGWFDGEGMAYNPVFIDELRQDFVSRYPKECPLPYIYPTPDGDVRAEWTLGSVEISLAIEEGTYEADWFAVDCETGKFHEKRLDLRSDDAWHWLIDSIQDPGVLLHG